MKTIPHNKPWLGLEEEEALRKVVESGWVIAGNQVKKLEKKLSEMLGLRYAVAVSSGTAAIHLSLLALGVGRGDDVILPSYTVSDILNAINYTGANPVIVDIEKDSFNIDPSLVAKKINKKTKAIIVPHMLGGSAKIDELEKFGIPIINDSAQALGTYYNQKPAASYGNLSVLSFYATKVVTTGQGGMVLTNNKKYLSFIKDVIDYNGRDNYKTRFNYPMTDIAASLGNIQAGKLGMFLKKRREIGAKYQKALKNTCLPAGKEKIHFFPSRSDTNSNYYRFILKFENKETRNRVKSIFGKKGITTIVPLNDYELLHNCLCLDKRNFVNAENLAATLLSLPIFPSLRHSEIERIVKVLTNL